MVDLVQWLTAQLDTDAECATAAAEEYGADWYYGDGFVLARHEGDMVATGSQDFLDRPQGEHIAAWDPARVLREIDAKRRIIAAYESYDREAPELDVPESVLRLLALPYADKPGYREEWAL